jgi:hypothetical protein
MIRAFALVLWLLAVVAGLILFGLLTNWFRYGLSLEATVVATATVLAVLVVGWTSYLSHVKNNVGFLILEAVAILTTVGMVLHVYDKALGGLPHFYISDNEKSPAAVLQTRQGFYKYWIEIENPFSASHKESLVIDCGHEKRITIQVFSGPAKAYMSASEASDWGTLSLTSDPKVAILTLGPAFHSLNPSGDKFQIDIKNSTAIKLPNN